MNAENLYAHSFQGYMTGSPEVPNDYSLGFAGVFPPYAVFHAARRPYRRRGSWQRKNAPRADRR